MRRLVILAAMMLATPARAHVLDEYLQAAVLSVNKTSIQISLRLVPGEEVLAAVMKTIDANRDGVISPAEGRVYAAKVLADISLTLDGQRLAPRLTGYDFPAPPFLRDGMGEIHIAFSADVPPGGARRTLVFRNRHQSRIAAYLANALVPADPAIHLIAQHRSADQSSFTLEYRQGAAK